MQHLLPLRRALGVLRARRRAHHRRDAAVRAADASGKGDLAFHRCAHCGTVTHWAGVHDTPTRQRLGPEAKMGINCRMLPEELIRGVERIRTSV